MCVLHAALLLALLLASFVIEHPTTANNQILKDLKLSVEEILPGNKDKVIEYLKKKDLEKDKLYEARVTLGHVLFKETFLNIADQKNFKQNYKRTLQSELDLLGVVPGRRCYAGMQRTLMKRGANEMITFLYEEYVHWKAIISEKFSSESKESPIEEKLEKELIEISDSFSFTTNIEKHTAIIPELFPVHATLDEALSFCTQDQLNRTNFLKKMIAAESKNASNLQVQIYQKLGCTNFILRYHLLAIKNASGSVKAEKILHFVLSLMDEVNDMAMELPSWTKKHFNGLVPFSREWMYVKYRLIAMLNSKYFEKGSKAERMCCNFVTLTVLMSFRMIVAMKPFISLKKPDILPYILFESDLKDNDNAVLDAFENRISLQANVQSNRGGVNMQKLFSEVCAVPKYEMMKPLTVNESNQLLNIPEMKAKARIINPVQTGEKEGVVVFGTNETAAITDVVASDVSNSETKATDNPSVMTTNSCSIDEVADNASLSTTTTTSIAPTTTTTTSEASPASLSTSSVSKPAAIMIDASHWYNEEEAAEWIAIYERDLIKYAAVKELEVANSEFLKSAKRKASIIPAPSKIENNSQTRISSFTLNDFFELFPDVAVLYSENVTLGLAFMAMKNKSMRFRWFFDPSIVIKQKTFLFLCQVFGEAEGKKTLTFVNFQKAYLELNGQIPPKGKSGDANRTVFRSSHSFLVDGVTCIPPIGGVHPEHLSSRFNHIQIRTFLSRSGFHPYFFEHVEE